MTYREIIDAVVAAHTKLTASGFGTDHYGVGVFAEERAAMYSDSCRAEFEVACSYLANFRQLKHINADAGSSYGLKHAAERSPGCYVSNGMFIAAAVHLEFKVRRCDPQSPNAWFNISSARPREPAQP